MTLPFGLGSLPLPDWLPWWVPAVLLIPALIYALLVLIMPFGVFGVKARLDVIEARLDDVQAELRSLAARLPPMVGDSYPPVRERPAIRPEPAESVAERVRLVSPAPVAAPRADSRPAPRAEPRFGAR